MLMTICPYCEGFDAEDARATDGTTCECLVAACGHYLNHLRVPGRRLWALSQPGAGRRAALRGV
jgi:hypothetical protein